MVHYLMLNCLCIISVYFILKQVQESCLHLCSTRTRIGLTQINKLFDALNYKQNETVLASDWPVDLRDKLNAHV